MRESPRTRRLRTDHAAVEKLRNESSIFDFDSIGQPADTYHVRFHGAGLWRPNGSPNVLVRDLHEVTVKLGSSYPRMMPELNWNSPIFHPNISASGVVCLGGYGTHWVPSLSLDDLCEMLWDMIRYRNFDVDSPYNREAALWAKNQTGIYLPVDHRPLRDRLANEHSGETADLSEATKPPIRQLASMADCSESDVSPDVLIIHDSYAAEVIDAELVDSDEICDVEDADIVFLD